MNDFKFKVGDKVYIVDPMTIVSSGRIDGENVYGVKRSCGGITTLREDDIKLIEIANEMTDSEMATIRYGFVFEVGDRVKIVNAEKRSLPDTPQIVTGRRSKDGDNTYRILSGLWVTAAEIEKVEG